MVLLNPADWVDKKGLTVCQGLRTEQIHAEPGELYVLPWPRPSSNSRWSVVSQTVVRAALLKLFTCVFYDPREQL